MLDDGRLINPTLGGADGGETGNWGRTYPYGGILDPASGEWSALPDPPDGEEDCGSGVLTESGGHYFGYRGWILDTTTSTWIGVPPLDTDELVTGRTVVAAGADLLVFGGARWKPDSFDATLLADAWVWSPRASGSESSSAPSSARSSALPPRGPSRFRTSSAGRSRLAQGRLELSRSRGLGPPRSFSPLGSPRPR